MSHPAKSGLGSSSARAVGISRSSRLIPGWLAGPHRFRRVQPFPILFAYSWVVGIFALSSSPLPHLWRPLIIALAFTSVIVFAGVVLARGTPKAQLIAGCVALSLLGAWPFVAAMVVIGAWRFGVDRLRRRQARRAVDESATPQVLRIANGFSWILAVVTSVNVVLSGGLGLRLPAASAQVLAGSEDHPNIYLVLLDGYPRADTLLRDFNFDNGSFLAALGARGFDVAGESRSNYTKTLMTLASVLNMDYTSSLERLTPPGDSAAAQARQLSAAINDSSSVATLRSLGYEVVASGSAFGEVALMSADVYLESGGLTQFEHQIARFTWLASVVDTVAPQWMPEEHRQSVRTAFANWQSVAEQRSDQPRFMLTHVLSPHAPFVFTEDGSPHPVQECFPEQCALWDTEMQATGLTHAEISAGFTSQLVYLNGLILDTADAVIAADPDAVIVFFSDHGIRYDADDRDEFFRNFLASRTPGHAALFPEDASPVNILPLVLNTYSRSDLPMRSYEGWWSAEKPLDIERYWPQ